MTTFREIAHGHLAWASVLLLASMLAGCTSDKSIKVRDALEYQYLLEPDRTFSGEYQPIDLDGDGQDEMVKKHALQTPGQQGEGVLFKTLSGQSIDQVNFDAILSYDPLIYDWDQDGKPETIVSIIREDSLFLRILDVSLTDRKIIERPEFFLFTGAPRYRNGEVFKWDPYLMGLANTEGGPPQKDNELVTAIVTGYAGMPRGLLKHSLATGELVDSLLIGSPPGHFFIEDVDEDGAEEMVLVTSSTDNDVSVNGYRDDRAYLLVIDLKTFDIEWDKEIGYKLAYPELIQADLDGDGNHEYLLRMGGANEVPLRQKLRLIDFKSRRLYGEKNFEAPVMSVHAVNLDHDLADELIVLDENGTLYLYEDTNQYRKVKLDVELKYTYLSVVPDADGDGVQEIIVHSVMGDLFLAPDLAPKAFYPYSAWNLKGKGAKWGQIKTGVDSPPMLYLVSGEYTTMFHLSKNTMYWWHRYGSWLGWGFGLLVFFTSTVVGTRYLALKHRIQEDKKRVKEHEALKEHISDYLLHASDKATPFLEQVRTILSRHASDENFTVKELAKELGLGSRQVQRKLQLLTGMTPSELIWQYRIRHAAELLQDTKVEKTVSEIAFETGFKDAAHLSRRFRKEYKVSPKEFRKSRSTA